jgi:hypothetical protein
MACESCGTAYAASRVRILARREGIYLAGLTCASCGTAAVAIVSFERGSGRADLSPLAGAVDRRRPRLRPEASVADVDVDDVVDMHRFLETFDGDFRRLFDTTYGGSATRGRGA